MQKKHIPKCKNTYTNAQEQSPNAKHKNKIRKTNPNRKQSKNRNKSPNQKKHRTQIQKQEQQKREKQTLKIFDINCIYIAPPLPAYIYCTVITCVYIAPPSPVL